MRQQRTVNTTIITIAMMTAEETPAATPAARAMELDGLGEVVGVGKADLSSSGETRQKVHMLL